MRIDELASTIKDKLVAAGISEADNETRVILREVAAISPSDIFSHPEKEVTEETLSDVLKVVERRCLREPLQYILGKWDFMGLDFEVQSGVLIPRPDTEILVECILKEIHDGMRFLDLCTGTGCIAISLLNYTNDCEATAVDISPVAYELAKKNAGRYPKSEKLNVVLGDLYEEVSGTFDIIVSNPPYINSDVIETLETEVKDYEPRLALDGGNDGLDLIKRIISGAPGYLNGGGKLFLEIGYDQGEAVVALMEQAGFKYVECVKDYAGLDRVVRGEWSSVR